MGEQLTLMHSATQSIGWSPPHHMKHPGLYLQCGLAFQHIEKKIPQTWIIKVHTEDQAELLCRQSQHAGLCKLQPSPGQQDKGQGRLRSRGHVPQQGEVSCSMPDSSSTQRRTILGLMARWWNSELFTKRLDQPTLPHAGVLCVCVFAHAASAAAELHKTLLGHMNFT